MSKENLNVALARRTTWNWLPAFVEVADAGSVVAASRRLSLTPAAISRTIGLLEASLGQVLFNRVGRRLVLNLAGSALRDAVRRAIFHVDGGLTEVSADPLAGHFRVASLGVLTDHFVVPALIALKARLPSLMPEHSSLRPGEANDQLLRGELDVAFAYESLSRDDLEVERIGETSMSVYCGRAHPLFHKKRVTEDDILAHAFSVPQTGDTGRIMDGWPTDLARQVGMRITTLRSNLDVGTSGILLTVLPDVTARPEMIAGKLRRLRFERLPLIEVFALRASSARREKADLVIREVRGRISAANQQLISSRRPASRRSARR